MGAEGLHTESRDVRLAVNRPILLGGEKGSGVAWLSCGHAVQLVHTDTMKQDGIRVCMYACLYVRGCD